MYQCDECGAEYDDGEIEDSLGAQVKFSCDNGCGNTIEEVNEEEDDDDAA